MYFKSLHFLMMLNSEMLTFCRNAQKYSNEQHFNWNIHICSLIYCCSKLAINNTSGHWSQLLCCFISICNAHTFRKKYFNLNKI